MKIPLNFKKIALVSAVVAGQLGGVPVSTVYAQDSSMVQHNRIQETAFKTIMTFNQHFADDGTMAVTAKSGPLTKSTSGFGLERLVQDITAHTFSGFPRALTPHLGKAETMTQAEALATAKQWMNVYVHSTAMRMAEELRTIGASAGILTFNEEVYISRPELEPVKKILSFIMTVDRDGKATYGAPVLTTPEPDIIYATYTPLRPGDDFDEEWVLPHPGHITYQVLDFKGNVKLTTRHIDVAGAYDGSAVAGTAECFVNKTTPGCSIPSHITDVRDLMIKYGADYAVADYTSQIVPVYDEVKTPSGEVDYQPRGAIAYTDRHWNCVEYTNEGEYGFVLDIQVDRYFAKLEADESVSVTYSNSHAGTMLSPMKKFNKVVLASALTGHPDNYVISPLDGDNTIYQIGDPVLEGVDHIAPVRASANTDELLAATVTGHFPLGKESGGSGWSIFTYGIVGDNYYGTGEYNGSIDFNLRSIHDFQEFSLLTQQFDDWLLITINDKAVFSGPYDDIASMRAVRRASVSSSNRCVASNGQYYCGSTPFNMVNGRSSNHTPSGSHVCGASRSVEDTGQVQNCVDNVFATYPYCSESWSGGDADSFYGWSCSDSKHCGNGGPIEYTRLNGSVGCGYHEHGVSWSRSYERTLLPHLKTGKNSLKAKLFVGGGGEMYVRFRVHGCGTELGLSFDGPPAIPPHASSQSLLQKLLDSMQRPAVTED